ncbi:MAG TPA: GDP-mannose 4,6-dehydratase [Acidobacteriota bacterium]|nr:GDP-mannose 4,6-dehydratase [Acidobacteriota bacterium]
MRILITGGAGFIGSFLAEAYLEQGEEVYVIDDLSTGSLENIKPLLKNSQFHFVNDTILNREVMLELIGICDVVVHLAAAVGVKLIIEEPLKSIHTNIVGTENVLELSNKFRKKTFIASTSEVYGRNSKVPLSEDDMRIYGSTDLARWSYAATKAMDEFLALAYYRTKQLPVIIARFFNTVGPRQTGRYGMVVPRFVGQALRNEPITVYGDGTQTRSFTYVEDVVRGVRGLVDEPRAVGGIFNIGGELEISINNLAARVKALTGSSSSIVHIPYENAYMEGFEDMERRVPDISRIRELLGYRNTHDLDDMLSKVVEYERTRI